MDGQGSKPLKRKPLHPPRKQPKVPEAEPEIEEVYAARKESFGPVPLRVKDRQKPLDKSRGAQTHHAAMAWLRQLAGLTFITNQDPISISDISRMENFRDVPLRTLTRWAAVDQWGERRNQFFLGIRQEIELRLQTKIINVRMNQLAVVDEMFEQAVRIVQSQIAEPNSLEGMIGAAIKLLDVGDRLRERVQRDAIPTSLGQGVHPANAIQPELSEGEAREAAKAIMRLRRENMRMALQAPKEERQPLVDFDEDEDIPIPPRKTTIVRTPVHGPKMD